MTIHRVFIEYPIEIDIQEVLLGVQQRNKDELWIPQAEKPFSLADMATLTKYYATERKSISIFLRTTNGSYRVSFRSPRN